MSVQEITIKFGDQYSNEFFSEAINELYKDQEPNYSEYFTNNRHTVCAERAGKIVGAVALLFSKSDSDDLTIKCCERFPNRAGKNWDGKSWLITFIIVHKDHRLSGVALELFKGLATIAKKESVESVQYCSNSVDLEELVLREKLYSRSLRENGWFIAEERSIGTERFPNTTMVTIKPIDQ